MIIAGIFVVGLWYLIFSYILYNQIQSFVNPSIANSSVNTTGVQNSLSLLQTTWTYWPLIFLIGMVVFGLYAAQKREIGEY